MIYLDIFKVNLDQKLPLSILILFILEKLNEMNHHVDVQVNYWKEEVEIRAESLKIEIDEIKESLFTKLEKVKIDFEG
jgi:hypothetical protein